MFSSLPSAMVTLHSSFQPFAPCFQQTATFSANSTSIPSHCGCSAAHRMWASQHCQGNPSVLISPCSCWQPLPLQLSQASCARRWFAVPSQAGPQKELVFHPRPPVTLEEWWMLPTLEKTGSFRASVD